MICTRLSRHFIFQVMDKESLRKEASRHRDFIDPADDHPEDAIPYFLDAIRPEAGQIIAGYWPKGREFDCRPILDEAMKLGCRCALPVIQKNTRILKFALWADGQPLQEGTFGILQPEETEFVTPDIIITPLLAFDRHGYRLGYGGGYYDATIRDLRDTGAVTAVGVAYSQQAVLFNLPVEDHDQQMDWIITPQSAIDHRHIA